MGHSEQLKIAGTDPVPPTSAELRALLKTYIDDKGATIDAVARKCGYKASSVISEWLRDKYAGDNGEVDRAVFAFLAREKRREAGKAPLAFVETDIAGRILGALERAHDERLLVTAHGDAGLGKTTAARRYRDRNASTVRYIVIDEASGATRSVMQLMAASLDLPTNGDAPMLAARIRERLVGCDFLFIFDEAQHLTDRALNQLRSFYDDEDVRLPMAFLGNDWVVDRRTRRNMAQFWSRVAIDVECRNGAVEAADLAPFMRHYEVAAELTESVLAVARSQQGLRKAIQTLELASKLTNGKPVKAADWKTAMKNTGLRGVAERLGR
jgi:DNA transposition AAA+ family ATPase